MNKQDIHTLVARFLEGETTLEEERTLYAFFQGEDVPEDLKEYQGMFRAYAAIAPCPSKGEGIRDARKSVSLFPVRQPSSLGSWGAWIAAACLVAVSLIGYTLYMYNAPKPQEEARVMPTPKPERKAVPKPKEEKVENASVPSIPSEVLLAEHMKPSQKQTKERFAPQKRMAQKSTETVPSVSTTLPREEHQTYASEECVAQCTAIYASHETAGDTAYQDPKRMDDFIAKLAAYNEIESVPLECAQMEDSTVMSAAYVFPDKKDVDVFGRLLQAACWYDDATPGYHLNFSHLQFFFELRDERKGLKYLWIADRINGKIMLYCTHSPIGTAVSSECYQNLRDELMHAKSINTKTKVL